MAFVLLGIVSIVLYTRNPLRTNFIFDEQEALLANPYVRSIADAHPKFRWLDAFPFSYYTSNDTLSYVKVAGRLGFDYKHAIAIPKSSPELVLILNEGLDSVTEAEMQVLLNKWISIDLNDLSGSNSRALDGTANQNSVVPWLVFVGFVILVSGTIVLVLILQRRQYTFPRFRRRAIPKDVQKEIEDLRIAQEELNHDLAQISELEKDIESKLSDSSKE